MFPFGAGRDDTCTRGRRARRLAVRGTIAIALVLCGWFAADGPGAGREARAGETQLAPITGRLDAAGDPGAAFADAVQSGVARQPDVFGPDDRVAIDDTKAWRNVAFLIRYDDSKDVIITCSGTMLAPNVVLTAAHCVYPQGGSNYIGSLLVAPGATHAAAPYGTAFATRFAVPKGWAATQGALPSLYDFALVFIDNSPFRSLAPFPIVASLPDSYFTPDVLLTTAGFPGDKPVGSMWTTTIRQEDYFFDADYLYTRLDILPGQSGSPIFTNDPSRYQYVVSVVSGGGPIANVSTRFTAPVITALNSYCRDEGCSFGSVIETNSAYAFGNWVFCHSTAHCDSGAQVLSTGGPAFVDFAISPNPLQQIHADVYWNGQKQGSLFWQPPPYTSPATFDVSGSGIAIPNGEGVVELHVWVGGTYVGVLSAGVVTRTHTVEAAELESN